MDAVFYGELPETYVPMEKFTKEDNEGLLEWIVEERNSKPGLETYMHFEAIAGKKQKYINPTKYFLKTIKKSYKQASKLDEIEISNFKDFSQESLSCLKNMPKLMKLVECSKREHELYIAYAKQVAQEKDQDLYNTVRDLSCRDEVYKRMFDSRETYEQLHTLQGECVSNLYSSMHIFKADLIKKISPLDRVPILGWLLTRSINKALKKVPPNQMMESYVKENNRYDAQRANRIYGKQKPAEPESDALHL